MSTRYFSPRRTATAASGTLAGGGRQPPVAIRHGARRRSFTLVEMLTVVTIIGILAGTVLFALYNATREAKIARTKTQIQRLHQLLMTRWESYRTRPIRIMNLPPVGQLDVTAQRGIPAVKLTLLRDLMRMELPDCVLDVTDAPVTIPFTYTPLGGSATTANLTIPRPSLAQHYRNRAPSTWTSQFEGAECLYLIISSIHDNGTNGLDFLQPGEIGDVDGDGMPEILDAWGKPLVFVRWPAGFVAHPGADYKTGTADDIPSYSNLQVPDAISSPDPFDPLRADPRNTNPPKIVPMASGAGAETYKFCFALYPLICSAGPDGAYEIVLFDYDPAAPDTQVAYSYFRGSTSSGQPQDDPYGIMPKSGRRLAEPFLKSTGFADNITNHFEVK